MAAARSSICPAGQKRVPLPFAGVGLELLDALLHGQFPVQDLPDAAFRLSRDPQPFHLGGAYRFPDSLFLFDMFQTNHPVKRFVLTKRRSHALKPDFNLDIFHISQITSQFLKDTTRRSIVADRCRKSKCLFGVLFLFFG